MKHITILGDGSWGTACATLLASNGIHVTLWCYNEEVAQEIRTHQENRTYLPDITLNTDYIHSTTSYEEAVSHADHVCFAVPVKYLRSVLSECHHYMHEGQTWISLSKGIEQETWLLPTHIVTDVAPCHITTGVIAGPSFAREVAHQKPTGLMCAMESQQHAQPLIDAFSTDYTPISYTHDIDGTQISGALKNVYALASGIIQAQTHASNTAALLTTHTLSEMRHIAQKCGGESETLLSLAGVGDLILTCQGGQSRNHKVGYKIGSGTSLDAYLAEVDFVPEGVNTLTSVYNMIQYHNIDAPLIHATYDIVHHNASADTLIHTLLTMPY